MPSAFTLIGSTYLILHKKLSKLIEKLDNKVKNFYGQLQKIILKTANGYQPGKFVHTNFNAITWFI